MPSLFCTFLYQATPTSYGGALQRVAALFLWTIAILTAALGDSLIIQLVKATPRAKHTFRILICIAVDILIGWGTYYVLPSVVYLVGLTSGAVTFPGALLFWGVGAIVTFAIANIAFYLIRELRPTSDLSAAMIFSIFWGITTGVAVLISIFFLFPQDPVKQVKAFIFCILGALAGWLLGMYITPQDPNERSEFAKIGTALAGLASGYTVKGIQDWAFGDGKPYALFLLLSLICAAVTVATIYNVRAYGVRVVRISVDGDAVYAADKETISLPENGSVLLRAAVSGVDDSSIVWSVFPNEAKYGKVDKGKYSAPASIEGEKMKVAVRAESAANPGLVGFVNVEVHGPEAAKDEHVDPKEPQSSDQSS